GEATVPLRVDPAPSSFVPASPLLLAAWVTSAVVIVGLAAAGLWIGASGSGFRGDDDELGVMAFVRGSHRPGDVYFLPVEVPDLARSTRGSLSCDFKPLAVKKRDPKVIPVGCQRLR